MDFALIYPVMFELVLRKLVQLGWYDGRYGLDVVVRLPGYFAFWG